MMFVQWTLKQGDHEILTMPRVAVLRSFIMNHLIHHRGQLSVYLRLRNVPLPSIYGPRLMKVITVRHRLLLPFAFCLFVVLATLNSAGYRYGASDQALYIPAVLRHLDPALFPQDAC